MSMQNPVNVRREASVATIELNDPPYNRLSMALIDALETTVEELEGDESVRAVILRGSGDENFSVGADIRVFYDVRSYIRFHIHHFVLLSLQ